VDGRAAAVIWLFLSTFVIGAPVLLYLVGRHSERALAQKWELLLTPRGERQYQELEQRMSADLELTEMAYTRAQAACEQGSPEQTMALLDLGCELIAQFSPTMMKSLAAMTVLSRMVSAVAPVQPLRGRQFELRQIASLASLNQLVHHFLATTAERFRLRAMILGRCFALMPRIVAHSTGRVRQLGPETIDVKPEWDQLRAARHDVRVLSDESLETFRVLLMSMAAERRDHA